MRMEQAVEEQIGAVEIFGGGAEAQVLGQHAAAAAAHFQDQQVGEIGEAILF